MSVHWWFLVVCYLAGVVAWLVKADYQDSPLMMASAVIAGLGAGFFLSALA